MRSLNKNEKRLLILCVTTIFIVANVIVLKHWITGIQFKQKQIALLEGELRAIELLRMEEDLWLARQAWLDANMPDLTSAGRRQGELLEQFQQAAAATSIEISNQKLNAVELGRFNRKVSVSLRASGPEESIHKWLAGVQSPTSFTLIESLDLRFNQRRSEQEETNYLDCSVTVARRFKL
jgi:hypothetical protein